LTIVRYAHYWNGGMAEYWNDGFVQHGIEKYHDLCNKQIMDRKNINRGFKKLRVWQDAITLYVLACKVFTNFPFELKKVASNIEVRRF
jgi:hypothetical protein